MKYNRIEEYIEDKKLLTTKLIGKKILYYDEHHVPAYREFKILEMIPEFGNHIRILIKVRDMLTNNQQEVWLSLATKNIRYVKEEVEEPKDKNPEKGTDSFNWKDYLKKKAEEDNALDEMAKTYPPSTKYPKSPFPNGIPDVPQWPHPATQPYSTICSLCGLKCSGTMGYCCPNDMCPMGMGPILCSTVTKDTSCKTVTISPECGNDPDAYKTVCGNQTTLDSPNDRNTID